MDPLDLEQTVTAIRDYFPSLTPQEQRIAVSAYRLLALGSPVTRAALAGAVNLPLDIVSKTLNGWWGIQFDDADRVIGFWGLTLQRTAHRLRINDQALYTWCAWDTLFVPSIVGEVAYIESRCPASDEPIHLAVTPNQVTAVSPEHAVLSFITPDADAVKDDIITNFCHYVFFMSSREAGTRWVVAHPGTYLMSISDAFTLGQKINRMQYADAIDG
jgi:alkylmercury lyase